MENNSIEVQLSEDSEKYLSLFYTPKFSAYSLLKAFFAKLHIKKITKTSRDLADFFYNLKLNEKYEQILKEIKFRNNGVFVYSNELDDCICTLQNMGLLGKENPSFGKILVKYSDAVAAEALSDVPIEYQKLFDEMVEKYLNNSIS